MAAIERLTITLPSEMAAMVKGAVAAGDYASSSEVIRDALRAWKRALELKELKSLKSDIERGLADLAAGRIKAFDPDRTIERGKRLFTARSRST